MGWTNGPWTMLAQFVGRRRGQVALALRMTVAAVVSLSLAQCLDFGLPLWAVLTSIVVTQGSVGSSLKATVDYFAGTLGGAIYGGLIALLIPHFDHWALLGVLAIALAPPALIAALVPSLKSAPITAVIVLLVPEMTHTSPLGSIVDRILEVALGGSVGLLVSSLLFPSSAYGLASDAGARILEQLALTVEHLMAAPSVEYDAAKLRHLQQGIGQSLSQLTVSAREAEHERTAHLVMAPPTGPLLRTLLRLRHDLVLLGRSISTPLSGSLAERLQEPLDQIRVAAVAYFRAGAEALRSRRPPPSMQGLTATLSHYALQTAKLRQEGLTRGLTDDAVERFFSLGFALEQLGHNVHDLDRCIAEWARVSNRISKSAP